MTKSNSGAPSSGQPDLTRRTFLRSSAAAGVALSYSKIAAHAQSTAPAEASDTLNVALVGCGTQGGVLRSSALRIPGVRFVALCDLWENRARSMSRGIPGMPKAYVRIEEMLKAHPEIDCVLIATPDVMHAPYSRMALEAGKHVYCEKMMSNTLEAARDMVLAQRQTGKLLQIGHQRRSNPRYILMRDRLMREKNLLGQITHLYGQWNRSVKAPTVGRSTIGDALLKEFGYDSMFQYENWRWFKKFGGGPISDLGAHQIDIFNWLLGATPKAVTASGGLDYYVNRPRPDGGTFTYEHLDNAIVVYEYDTPWGLVRALYQVLTTNGSQNYYEKIMGVEGTVVISEQPVYNQVYREKDTTEHKRGDWEALVREGLLRKPPGTIYNKFWERPKAWNRPDPWLAKEGAQDVRVSIPADPYELPALPKELAEKPPHQFHLENFFDTVRKNGKQTDLNCPVEEAYKCAVAVLSINDAVATGRRIEFKPEDFIVA